VEKNMLLDVEANAEQILVGGCVEAVAEHRIR
jgi:hypothetical protein